MLRVVCGLLVVGFFSSAAVACPPCEQSIQRFSVREYYRAPVIRERVIVREEVVAPVQRQRIVEKSRQRIIQPRANFRSVERIRSY